MKKKPEKKKTEGWGLKKEVEWRYAFTLPSVMCTEDGKFKYDDGTKIPLIINHVVTLRGPVIYIEPSRGGPKCHSAARLVFEAWHLGCALHRNKKIIFKDLDERNISASNLEVNIPKKDANKANKVDEGFDSWMQDSIYL